MSTNPDATPWLSSSSVRSLIAAMGLALLFWVSICLGTNVWDWKQLASSEIAILIPFLKRLTDPDIVAPLSVLNFRNPK